MIRRKEAGFSQESLAKGIRDLGKDIRISQSTIRDIELGRIEPKEYQLKAIASVLGVSVSAFSSSGASLSSCTLDSDENYMLLSYRKLNSAGRRRFYNCLSEILNDPCCLSFDHKFSKCPFCGNYPNEEDIEIHKIESGFSSDLLYSAKLSCGYCSATVYGYSDKSSDGAKEEAVKNWNTRFMGTEGSR